MNKAKYRILYAVCYFLHKKCGQKGLPITAN